MTIDFYGVDKNIAVTPAQILKLERAIGYNLATVKRRIHRMCFNFCDCGMHPDADWEQLCRMGLARRADAFGRICYKATDRGIDLVSMLTGCKIYKQKGMWNGED